MKKRTKIMLLVLLAGLLIYAIRTGSLPKSDSGDYDYDKSPIVWRLFSEVIITQEAVNNLLYLIILVPVLIFHIAEEWPNHTQNEKIMTIVGWVSILVAAYFVLKLVVLVTAGS